jgi:glycine/D-amino acid oxidase-like deaminating enzyme
VRLAERAETAELLGTARYRGALLDDRAGALNPLAYARGLAGAAQRLGARISGGTRVRALSRESGRWKLSAGSGTVTAGTVLLCTNGYTDGLWPGLAREIIPIHSLQVATEPLGEDVRRSILPRGHVVSDTQRILLYFRLDDDGRLVMGGRGSLGETNRDGLYRFVEDAARRLFPQIGTPRWQYRWAGKVALTADHLPRVHELAPGLHACLGYNGRGVAMATALGRALGERVSSGDPERLPLPPTPMRPLPFHAFRRPALEVVTAWLRLRDRMSWKGSSSGQRPSASPLAGFNT